MSNRKAQDKCEALILAFEECSTRGLMAKLRGECFDVETAVRQCRHEARLNDRRQHAEKALVRQRKQDERLRGLRLSEKGQVPDSEEHPSSSIV